jgi:hypothetical protein
MKAIKIDVEKDQVLEIDIEGDLFSWYKEIGSNHIENVYRFPNGDMLLVEEEYIGYKKLSEVNGAFKFRPMGPQQILFGNALVIGVDEDGESVDAQSSLQLIEDNVIFINKRIVKDAYIHVSENAGYKVYV